MSDGSSNTLILGEVLTQVIPEDGWPWPGDGFGRAWIGTHYMGVLLWDNNDWGPRHIYKFASGHPGVMNFARGDGSVSSVSDSTARDTINGMAGMNDGLVVSLDF